MDWNEADIRELERLRRLARERQRRAGSEQRQRAEERKAEAEADSNAETDLIGSVAAASLAADIEQFETQIEVYETATVTALMRNEEQLAVADVHLAELLDHAHTLPDGRRVFRTEDGLQVFDEHGAEIAADVLDPAMIPDYKPSWESYSGAVDAVRGLQRERAELVDYQERLDATRERLDDEDLSRADLDSLRADLDAAMPDAVREELAATGYLVEGPAGRPGVLHQSIDDPRLDAPLAERMPTPSMP